VDCGAREYQRQGAVRAGAGRTGDVLCYSDDMLDALAADAPRPSGPVE
jgi:hypothetical protein